MVLRMAWRALACVLAFVSPSHSGVFMDADRRICKHAHLDRHVYVHTQREGERDCTHSLRLHAGAHLMTVSRHHHPTFSSGCPHARAHTH